MANTLTGLIPTIYKAFDIVLRELVGFIPAVTMDSSGEQAAKDQTISFGVTPVGVAGDITPATTGPTPGAQTIAPETMTISKSRGVPFGWNGEEQLSVGQQYNQFLVNQFAQAMRTLTNEVEADVATLYIYASRAYGTAGTTPFATNLAEVAQMRKILEDNGAPLSDLQLVLGTTAEAALRTLANLNAAGDAGTTNLLRRGVIDDLHGFAVRASGQTKTHTAGGATGTLVDLTAGYAKGSKTIHADTQTGVMVAGDVIANTKTGRDTSKYVVKTPLAAAEGDIVLQNPGIQVAWVNNDPLTSSASYSANLAFARSAINLMTRVPQMPKEGDAADDVTVITDELSGLSFQVAMYKQYRQITFEVGLAWGVKVVKSEAIAILLG